jgi:hypothetical protein
MAESTGETTSEDWGAVEPPNGEPHEVEAVLRRLRALAAPCEPPVGVGAFEVLYASEREVVVWYSPARAEHRPGEVAIPTSRLHAAWSALLSGALLDEAALESLGEGVAGGRWLLAVLAQLPGVAVRVEPLTLEWHAPIDGNSAQGQEAISVPPARTRRRPR